MSCHCHAMLAATTQTQCAARELDDVCSLAAVLPFEGVPVAAASPRRGSYWERRVSDSRRSVTICVLTAPQGRLPSEQ